MSRFKAALLLVLFIVLSFVLESESYIGVVDTDTYNTVTNFANECVKWRHLKPAALNQFKIWKKLKKLRKKVKLFLFSWAYGKSWKVKWIIGRARLAND